MWLAFTFLPDCDSVLKAIAAFAYKLRTDDKPFLRGGSNTPDRKRRWFTTLLSIGLSIKLLGIWYYIPTFEWLNSPHFEFDNSPALVCKLSKWEIQSDVILIDDYEISDLVSQRS